MLIIIFYIKFQILIILFSHAYFRRIMTKTDANSLTGNIFFTTNIYLIKYENIEDIVATKQQINKYLLNLKRSKKLTDNIRTIITNKYTYILIEEFNYKSKKELNERLNELRLLQNNRKKHIEPKLINDLYNNALQYEEEVHNILKTICCDSVIERSKYRYSKFDFYDLTYKYMFELKVNTYSISKYPNAVINIDKLVYPFLIIIFGYNETYYDNEIKNIVNYYYIEYDKCKFDNFNRRYIVNHKTGRSSLICDIPTTELKPLKDLKLKENLLADNDFCIDLINFGLVN